MLFLTQRKKSSSEKSRSAFTLIELLIVVAIIAILAAIAVPNFLAAQVRAKVSRVLNDLRTMRTAIESYAVDNTSVPRMSWGSSFGDTFTAGACEEIFGTLVPHPAKACLTAVPDPRGIGGAVTTPISYLSVLPTDPFVANPGGIAGSLDAFLYTYWDLKTLGSGLNASTGGNSLAYVPAGAALREFNRWLGYYVLWSIGPEGEEGFNNLSRCFFGQYDPTNGTVSSGSVFVSQKFFEPTWVDGSALEAGSGRTCRS